MDHKMIASNLQALKVDVINLSHRLDTLLEEVERLAFIEEADQHGMHVDSAIAVDGHIGLLAEVEVGDDVLPIPPSQ